MTSESALGRFADLQRQGFMKPRKAVNATKVVDYVACDACSDWHPRGKHNKPAGQRTKGEQRSIGKQPEFTCVHAHLDMDGTCFKCGWSVAR